MQMRSNSKSAIVASALWAAYGDALGFIGEFADARILSFRIHAQRITRTVPWRRRIGGRFGVTLALPAGCYSDDTQLRLATSRAIRSDGHFDVEAFAKVELPVWRAYSLGGGSSTKAAASSLTRGDVNWFSNFFSQKSNSYLDAGGNGAAMRIQPHVWAASDPEDSRAFLTDVIRNTICSHGNPRALAGSFFHAVCLATALSESRIPGPRSWREAVSRMSEIPDLIRQDDELNSFWFPVWRQRSPCEMHAALRAIQLESNEHISLIENAPGMDANSAYLQNVKSLGGFEPATRGSGIRTAILASALCWLFRDRPAMDALISAANALGSDTDTIATMAGAILGAIQNTYPEGDVADREYIIEESSRLSEAGPRTRVKSFRYPDLMGWKPPESLIDAVGLSGGHLAFTGLGLAEAIGDRWQDSRDKTLSWQWLKLNFGQTILARQRQTLIELPGQIGIQGRIGSQSPEIEGKPKMSRQPGSLNEHHDWAAVKKVLVSEESSLDELTRAAIDSGFNSELIGRDLVELASRKDGVELAVAYAAIIAKARKARIRAQRRKEEGGNFSA